MSDRPRLTIVGSSTWHFPLLPITPDGKHLRRGVVVSFPKPVPDSGTPTMANYLVHAHEEQRPPIGLGRRTFYDNRYVWDMFNINSMWGLLTLGPLKVSPTMTAGPATFKVAISGGFFESNVLSRVILFGNGAAANDEPVWLLTGTGTAYTDATLNADFVANLNNIASIVETNDTVYAFLDRVIAVGADNTLVLQTTDGTTWTRRTAAGTADVITGGANSFDRVFKVLTSPTSSTVIAACIYSSVTNIIGVPYAGNTITGTGGITFTATIEILESTAAPRGFNYFHGPDGRQDLFVSSNKGLFYIDLLGTSFLPRKVLTYGSPSGLYTGRMIAGPDDAIWIIDGQYLTRWKWLQQGNAYDFKRILVGQPMDAPEGAVFSEGTPIDAYGDFTAIASDPEMPWIYVAKSGLTGSRNARIYIYDYENDLWHCPYRNATASLAIMAIFVSSLDGTQPRLHIVEESVAGGDQDPALFDYINMNPLTNTAATYAASGRIDTTDFDGHMHSLRKGFYRTTFTSVGATGTGGGDERMDIQYSFDGGAFSVAQTIGKSPVEGVWTDGATALGTAATFMQMRLTLARGATTTNSPKIYTIGQEYEVLGLKSDNTPIQSFTVRISLDPNEYAPGSLPESPAAARTALNAILQSGPLVQLAIGEDFTTAAPAKVRLLPYAIVSQVGKPSGSPGPGFDLAGFVDVTFEERV